jgi:hypothetical protein
VLKVFLSSPGSAFQAEACRGQDVLLSYATKRTDMGRWAPSFNSLLIDSGAYSELNNEKLKVDLDAYIDWAARWHYAEAVAGLDHIRGDWRQSLANYERFPRGFPTFHPGADPDELLDDLIPMARERGGWIGLGVVPKASGSRSGQRHHILQAMERLDGSGLHVHGWALWEYSDLAFGSVDSTAWWRVGHRLMNQLPFLTAGECLEISIKQIQRRGRAPAVADGDQLQLLEAKP